MSNRLTIALAAAAVLLVACRKDDAADADALAKALDSARSNAAAAAPAETDMVARARSWCGSMTAAGTGHDVDLDRNTTTAAEFAASAASLAARWEAIRQSLQRVRLRAEAPRERRAKALAAITRHHAELEKLRNALEETAKQFRALAQDRAYTGDTVPPTVTKLDAILGSFDPPPDLDPM